MAPVSKDEAARVSCFETPHTQVGFIEPDLR